MIEDSLKAFLAEDIGFGDITTLALVEKNAKGEGHVLCRENAVIAGIEEALLLLEVQGCKGVPTAKDGMRVKAGAKILSLTGPAQSLLVVERTILNLISHMSGIATATADLVSIADKVSAGKVRIACTRKTLPGLRYFEKKAVSIGGGDTHRFKLDDAVLIKDNHLPFAGSIADAVKKAKTSVSFTKKIEVETTRPSQAVEAAMAGADIVLLDNMSPQDVKKSVDLLKTQGLRDRVVVEASGGITTDNIASYAKCGVDVISAGVITHSARSIDMSMEIRESNKGS